MSPAFDSLAAILVQDEGLRLKPYLDTEGKLTLGYGRNLYDVGISHEEALMLLQGDMRRAYNLASSNFKWLTGLNQARQDVILSMVFNMGLGGILKFKGMIAALERNDFNKAADEMLNSRWSAQVGVRAVRLAQMMRTGV